VTGENVPVQTVGHITGYCPGQRNTITTAHHTTWKTLQRDIPQATPKGWDFPSLDGELTIGQLWIDNKLDEVYTMDDLWETVRDSETQRTLKEPSPHQTQKHARPHSTHGKQDKPK
jgi:hypothetical protein